MANVSFFAYTYKCFLVAMLKYRNCIVNGNVEMNYGNGGRETVRYVNFIVRSRFKI